MTAPSDLFTRQDITRKPPSARFVCIDCGNVRQPQDWLGRTTEHPPLCNPCTEHWGQGFGWNNAGTRGEHRHMRRLKAMIEILRWRARNEARN